MSGLTLKPYNRIDQSDEWLEIAVLSGISSVERWTKEMQRAIKLCRAIH